MAAGTPLASIPVPSYLRPRRDVTWQVIDFCERVASAVLLVSVSPLVAASAVAVSMASGRSPLIAHRRVGWKGSDLWMLKLRTMWDCDDTFKGPFRIVEYIDDHEGPKRKAPQDGRVPNGFARFCRRHSIDELPQLWHVLRGEMALVGPRPLTRQEFSRHYGASAEDVLEVKPGLAGLWQVSGRNRLTYADRRRLDLTFVRCRSLRMYVKVLLRTLPELVQGSNSW
jgi:exopolysaccharide production protein ExoY